MRHIDPKIFPLFAAVTGLTLGASVLSAGFLAGVPDFQTGFPVILDGTRVNQGSVALGDLDGDGLLDIVVGTWDGKIHAYDGTGSELWQFDTGDMAIESKPAIADVDGDGDMEVVATAGSTFTPNSHGGLYVISHDGFLQCDFEPLDDGDADTFREGVFSSPAVAELDGDPNGLEIAFGAWDRHVRVIHHDCTALWENDVIDTVWSSPAIGDVDRDGQLDVVIGVDSDDEPGPNGEQEGGILHVYDGATGAELAGFPIQIDEVIQSSPSLGDVTGDGWLEIVVGTGRCWANPACAPDGMSNGAVGEYLNAWDRNGNDLPGWPVLIPGTYAFASPALADLDDDGALEVIVNTVDPDDQNGGSVYALEADGSNVPGWPVQPVTPAGGGSTVSFSTRASPVVADLTGDGNLEVVLPSNSELVVWDRNGVQLSRDDNPAPPGSFVLKSNFTTAGSAAIGDVDGDGDLELIAGSADNTPGNPGVLYAWDFSGSATGLVPWPEFRRSADNRATVPGIIFADGFESGDLSAW